jgi:hypothetical protein
MSKLNRRKLQKMILQEFKMLGMGDPGVMGVMGLPGEEMNIGSHDHGCDACGMSPCGCDEYEDEPVGLLPAPAMSAGSLSAEDCCTAIMALVECCSCESTKQKIIAVCESILHGEDTGFYSS